MWIVFTAIWLYQITAAAVVTLRVWTPQGGAEAAERLRAHRADEAASTGTRDREETALGGGTGGRTTRTVEQAPAAESTRLSGGRLFLAFFPYLLVLCVLVFLQSTPVLGWMLP